jgi:hypothetical protein
MPETSVNLTHTVVALIMASSTVTYKIAIPPILRPLVGIVLAVIYVVSLVTAAIGMGCYLVVQLVVDACVKFASPRKF